MEKSRNYICFMLGLIFIFLAGVAINNLAAMLFLILLGMGFLTITDFKQIE